MKNNYITRTIPDNTPPVRLDKALALLCPDISRARLKPLIQKGEVTVNNAPITQVSYKVKPGDKLTLNIPDAIPDTPEAENIPLNILYEDDDLLVINKQAGLVVHPGAGNWTGTLVNALLYHCGDTLSGIGGVKRPGIVHRLDKDTSGLMLVAKHDQAHQGLSQQLEERSLSRIYSALVWKCPHLKKNKIDAALARHTTNRIKMAISNKEEARHAVTHYTVEKTFGDYASHITCQLETGRTHQIRVHMQHAGFPLLGDPLYGLVDQERQAILKRAGFDADKVSVINAFPRQALHAKEISFIHPVTGAEMHFESLPPSDWNDLYKMINTI